MPFDFIPPRKLVDLTIGATPITPGSTPARLFDGTIGAPSVASLFGLSISGVPANGIIGDATVFAPTIAGGTGPYTLTLLSGTLPPGRSISGLTVAGSYTTAGSYTYTLRVTDSTGATADLAVSVTVSTPAAGVPVNSAAPAISGTAQVGQTLTASTGTWSNSPTSFAYQWSRAGTPISGATSATYVPVSGDVGSALTVAVTASNAAGAGASVTSAATASVTAAGSTFTPTYLIKAGDSRVQYGGGYTNPTAGAAETETFTTSSQPSLGGVGALEALMDQIILGAGRSNYGVGGSTSRSLTKRLNVANNATTGNPAYSDTGTAADANYSFVSSAENSPISDPGNVVFLLDGTNDGTNTTYYNSTNPASVTMTEMTGVVDSLIAAGKFVVISNGLPQGIGTVFDEVKAVSSLSCTLSNVGNGIAAIDFLENVTTGARYTQVTTLTATGQFAVNTATGVVSFYTGDTITSAQITYDYIATAALPNQAKNKAFSEYMLSNAATFVSSTSVNYGFPGFQNNATRMASCAVIDSWNDFLDTNGYNKHDTLVDGVHPSPGGNVRMAKLVKAALQAKFPSLTVSKDKRPTLNSQKLGTTAANQTSFGPYTALGLLKPLPVGFAIFVGAQKLTSTQTGSDTFTLAGGTFTGSGTYSSGSISFTSTAAPATGSVVQLCGDGGLSIMDNGLMDPAQTGGTVPANVTGTLPAGWTLYCDTNVTNALAAGNLTIQLSSGTDSVSGLPKIALSIDGINNGTWAANAFGTINLVPAFSNTPNRITPGDKLRMGMVTNLKPADRGPNQGHVMGLSHAGATLTVNTSAGVQRPGTGATNANTAINTIASIVKTVHGQTADVSVPAAGQRMADLTPAADTTGYTVTALSSSTSILIPIRLGCRVAGVVEVSQAAIQPFN